MRAIVRKERQPVLPTREEANLEREFISAFAGRAERKVSVSVGGEGEPDTATVELPRVARASGAADAGAGGLAPR
jgi:hypothetical protein